MSVAKNILTAVVLATALAAVVPVASAMNTSNGGRGTPGTSTNSGGNSGEAGRVIIPYPVPHKVAPQPQRCTTVQRIVRTAGEASIVRPCHWE